MATQNKLNVTELDFDQIKSNLKNFLSIYNPINQKCWKLYRENKISQEKLRIKRLEETFEIIQFDIQFNKILEIDFDASIIYILAGSSDASFK